MRWLIEGFVTWVGVIKTVVIWVITFTLIIAALALIIFAIKSLTNSKIVDKRSKIRFPTLPNVSEKMKCAGLRKELLKRVHRNTADRLIALAKEQNPGKPEHWYLEKVIYDLKRGR